MRKIWLLIAFIAIVSCKNDTKTGSTVISGKIINNRGSEITLKMPNNKEFSETIKIALDGSFSDTLFVETGNYTFQYGRHRAEIFVEAGNNFAINFNARDFNNTLIFSGEGSEISTYLFEKQKQVKEMLGEDNSIYILDEAAFVSKLKEIKSTLEELISSSKGISNDFKEKEKRNLNYTYLVRLNNYQMFHSHYANDANFKTSDGFLKGLEEIAYDNEEDFIYSADYRTLTTSYYRKKAAEVARKEKIDNDIAFIKVVGALQKNTMKNELIYERIKYAFANSEDLEGLYNQFMASSTNETHKKEITESYKQFKLVVKGQPSPKFKDYENFAGGKTSMDDLKGNYVFINVWSTWSTPNPREMNFLKEIETTYKGKNIKFVSISVDKAEDHEKWKKMVSENKFIEIQLFADKGLESSFAKEYLIKTTPRYILVDPNGIIVNANAPRPSSKRLTRLFSELNI
ncbi:MAG: TlpA disulfide reductase family protein [Lutibacter sp.]|nr:TlpA disulfide reductase family protein [Lutibacter sp.]